MTRAQGEVEVFVCKGCKRPIQAGQLRRGDNWHAKCFMDLERSTLGKVWNKPKGPIPRGLTETQYIILRAAADAPGCAVRFLLGDRKGTRVVGWDDLDRPKIRAYGNPEYFLRTRGLLAPTDEPHVFRITDAGLKIVGRPAA